MHIKPSSAIRNDYGAISTLARETAEPIFITKNGEGDVVVMSIEAYEQREDLIARRYAMLDAERRSLAGEAPVPASIARARIEEHIASYGVGR